MKLSEKDIQKIDADIAKIACRRKTSPIIGIVPTQLPEEHILRVNDHYINAIVLAGGVPLILPLTADMRVYERLFGVVDGFVLTGGQDVDPKRYSNVADLDEQERSSYEQIGKITPMRDTIENLILRFACNNNMPLLGTCRGMQTMNVFFGGTLYLDLPSQFDGVDSISGMPISHWQKEDPHQTTHYISVKKGSKLHGCLGAETAAANSFHHQGVKTLNIKIMVNFFLVFNGILSFSLKKSAWEVFLFYSQMRLLLLRLLLLLMLMLLPLLSDAAHSAAAHNGVAFFGCQQYLSGAKCSSGAKPLAAQNLHFLLLFWCKWGLMLLFSLKVSKLHARVCQTDKSRCIGYEHCV